MHKHIYTYGGYSANSTATRDTCTVLLLWKYYMDNPIYHTSCQNGVGVFCMLDQVVFIGVCLSPLVVGVAACIGTRGDRIARRPALGRHVVAFLLLPEDAPQNPFRCLHAEFGYIPTEAGFVVFGLLYLFSRRKRESM